MSDWHFLFDSNLCIRMCFSMHVVKVFITKRPLVAVLMLCVFASCRSSRSTSEHQSCCSNNQELLQPSSKKGAEKNTRKDEQKSLDFGSFPRGDLVPIIGRDNGLSLF